MIRRLPALFLLLVLVPALRANPPAAGSVSSSAVYTLKFNLADVPAPGAVTLRCRARAIPLLPGADSPAVPAAISRQSSGSPCLLEFPLFWSASPAPAILIFYQLDAIGPSGIVLRSIHGQTASR